MGRDQPPTVLVPVACFLPTQIITAFVFWLSHQTGNPTGHELLFVHLSSCFLLVCIFPGFPIGLGIWSHRNSLVSQALGLKRLSLCGFSSSVSQSHFPSCCLQGHYFSGSPSHFCQTGALLLWPKGPLQGSLLPRLPAMQPGKCRPPPSPSPLPAPSLSSPHHRV